jgi:hypothetical protein
MIRQIQLWFFMRKKRKEITQAFKVGDTVYDTWDQEYTVTAVDPTGNHGIGSIWIKRKKDGFLSAQAFAGNDLTHTKKRA